MNMSLSKNLIAVGQLIVAAATGSVFGVFSAIFWATFMQDTTTFHPANNYGLENTWYQMIFNDQTNFKGDNGTDMTLVLGGTSQNECHSLKSYRNVSDGRSVKLFDQKNPDSYLPPGMKVHLYWRQDCKLHRPYGIITVPANAKEVLVADINKPSANYEVFNNYTQADGGDRQLGSHVMGTSWSIP
jgi:hypothetical protein